MILFHHTCWHSAEQIDAAGGVLVPHVQPMLGNRELLWFTTLQAPARTMLGLTSYSLTCDRTAHTYRVDEPDEVHSWAWWRGQLPHAQVIRLEAARGTRPSLWWATAKPQQAVRVR